MSVQQLRKLVHSAAEKLTKEAYQTPEAITDEQIEQLERLNRIVMICENSGPQLKPKRWPTIVILAAASLAMSIMLFFRVPATEIELDLTIREVQFRFSKEAVLTDAMVLTALGVSELEEIRLPRSIEQTAQTVQTQAYQRTGSALRLAALSDENMPGTLTLTTLLLPAGTLVKLNSTEVINQYRMVLAFPEKSAFPIKASVKGRIQIAPSGAPAEEYQFSTPSLIQMFPATNQVTLDLMLPEKTLTDFSPNLPAKSLAFVRLDQFMGTSETFIREVSTVESGTLYLSDLSSREYPLRKGESLQFSTSVGPIRLLTLNDNELSLQFHGKVSGMKTGWEENQKNLMPNFLEWLVARPGLMLFWSQSLSLFFLLIGIWRWWKTTG